MGSLKSKLSKALPLSWKLNLRRLTIGMARLGKRDRSPGTFSHDNPPQNAACEGPHVLVIDDLIPEDRDAGSRRMVFILKSLARHGRPVFVPLSKLERPTAERMLWEQGIQTAKIFDYKRLLKSRRFSFVILSFPHVAETMLKAIRCVDPEVKIIFDMVDVHFKRLDREFQLTGKPELKREAEAMRKLEGKLARAVDAIWCASPEDKKTMEQVAPGKPIEVITTIHVTHKRKLNFEETRDLLFVGNFHHRPNIDAVEYFLREVFPLIQKELPEVAFDIAGDNAPPNIRTHACDSVHVLGFVPEIEPLFQCHRVMIAPLRFGAGVKGKIGDALSHGLPVVTTSMGAEGMGFLNGDQVLIGDDPESFAQAVVKLYRDANLWRHMSWHGQQHIAANFSPKVLDKTIVRFLESDI